MATTDMYTGLNTLSSVYVTTIDNVYISYTSSVASEGCDRLIRKYTVAVAADNLLLGEV